MRASRLALVALCASFSAVAEELTPDVEIGGFSTRISLQDAARRLGREPICRHRERGEHSVRETCGFPIVGDDGSYTALLFAADGPLMEIIRYISLPQAMELGEALQQAKSQFSKLGMPETLVPGSSLDFSKCNIMGRSPANCVREAPPSSKTPYGIAWTSETWQLRVSSVSEKPKGLPDFPEALFKRRLLSINWKDLRAHEQHQARVRNQLKQLEDASKRELLKF